MNHSKNEIVKQYILKKIEDRIYVEGSMIASELQLCKQLQVSRMTVRKALDELVQDGIIYKEKGRGSFVAKKPKYAQFRCGVGFSQEAHKRGMVPSSKDAALELCEADETLAKHLHIQIGDKLWKVTRVRCADDIPVTYVEEYYLYSLCPDLTLDILHHSIYDHLESKGITYACLDQSLEAVLCDETIALKLGVKKGHPLIRMSIIVYMKNGVAYNCGTEYYRTDKFTLIQSIYHKDN